MGLVVIKTYSRYNQPNAPSNTLPSLHNIPSKLRSSSALPPCIGYCVYVFSHQVGHVYTSDKPLFTPRIHRWTSMAFSCHYPVTCWTIRINFGSCTDLIKNRIEKLIQDRRDVERKMLTMAVERVAQDTELTHQ